MSAAASDSSSKRIHINPDFFKIESSPSSKKTRSRRSRVSSDAAGADDDNEPPPPRRASTSRRGRGSGASDTLKKQLLQKIRAQQHAERDGFSSDEEVAAGATSHPAVSAAGKSEFENTLVFFDNIMKENQRAGISVAKPPENVSLSVPGVFSQTATAPPQNHSFHSIPHNQHTLLQPSPVPNVHIQPQYGCLKGGNLPTYRSLVTQRNRSAITSAPIQSHTPHTYPKETIPQNYHLSGGNGYAPEGSYRALGGSANFYSPPPASVAAAAIAAATNNGRVSDYVGSGGVTAKTRENEKEYEKSRIREIMDAREREEKNLLAAGFTAAGAPTKQKKTIKRTFHVGRSRKHPVVSVLVSNKTIRKRTMTDIQNLAAKPIHEIKAFLQKKGLIKVGSVAPNHVIRKMYENAYMLGGDIVNHNKETLLHNFLMDKEEN